MSMRKPAILLALAILAPAAAVAEPLSLNEVLMSSRRHAPQILEAVARTRAAQGRQVAAQGAFDTILSGELRDRAGGSYGGAYATIGASRPIADWGGSLYAGYSLSTGTFPTYESALATPPGGEIKVGAVFALLRDRAIDERRFAVGNAGLDVQAAELDQAAIAIAVQRRATSAYNAWVAAGLRLRNFESLLALAQERQRGLQRQVDVGARPRIVLIENEQAILRREALVARARQDLANATVSLSFFLRDKSGAPLRPDLERLPSQFQDRLGPAASEFGVQSRPDLRVLDVRLKQARDRVALERNAWLPRLDLRVEAAQGVPNGRGRSPLADQTALSVGLRFSLPLQQRTAAGRVSAANAEIAALARRRQGLEEQIQIEIARLSNEAEAARQIQKLTHDERDRAASMAAAERRRFESGASDFFLVNLREDASADAEARRVDANFRLKEALAELAAASMDLEALGLAADIRDAEPEGTPPAG
jgi:outer membrane protein TolC